MLEYNKRIISFNNKEKGLRNKALLANHQHCLIQQSSGRSLELKKQLDESALNDCKNKSKYELPNYSRNAHQYVSTYIYAHVYIDCDHELLTRFVK
jgi:hypothetical protein